MKLYEVRFMATKTLQNGKEVEQMKKVYMQPFDILQDNSKRHRSPERQIELGTDILEGNHYYNIRYVETKTVDRFVVSE